MGDIYLTTNSENPATKYLGTTWQKIEGRFLLGTSGSGVSKQTGGSNSKTIAQTNLPNVKLSVDSFSLSRGTMDITGTIVNNLFDNLPTGDGCFYLTSVQAQDLQGTNDSWPQQMGRINFQASRSWTGSTSSASPQTSALGSGQALDITPSYYTVHMWLRLT